MRSFAVAVFMLLVARAGGAQQLGQKLLGGVGIDAGTQALPGLYLIDRFGYFTSEALRNDEGDVVPIRGLDVEVFGNVLGLSFTHKLRRGPFLTFAAGVPLADLSVSRGDPRSSLDVFGFGDAFVQPLKLGWRRGDFDVVASYTAYVPTGRFEPRAIGGIGRGHWTHQFSLGSAAYLSRNRLTRISALVSYDLNTNKRGIDIKRGNTIQVQGGAGIGLPANVTIGIAGFALWQVSDDRGSDLPPALRGLRTRAFGLGPEINVVIPKHRLRAELRYETEFLVRSRIDGGILVAGLSYQVWRPALRPRR
jgi:hypothetical protein